MCRESVDVIWEFLNPVLFFTEITNTHNYFMQLLYATEGK